MGRFGKHDDHKAGGKIRILARLPVLPPNVTVLAQSLPFP